MPPGIDSLAETLTTLFTELKDSVPVEAVEHDESIALYFDIMTQLVSICRMLSKESPQGITTDQLYRRVIRGRILEYFKHLKLDSESKHVHLITLCADKQGLVPKRKAAVQARRLEKEKQKDKMVLLKEDCEWRFDDEGIYSYWDKIWAEDPTDIKGTLFNPLSAVFTRSVRIQLYHYFWRRMQKDDALWPIQLTGLDTFWGPRIRYVFDYDRDGQGAYVMDIDTVGNRTFSRLPENLIGEAENAVLWHLRRNWAERKDERISIFTSDGDMLAMLVMHFWFYDLAFLKTFIWHRNDFKLHSGFHVPFVINAFRHAGWTRGRFAALCALSNTDYCDKLEGIGHAFIRSACRKVNQELRALEIPETPSYPDTYVPVRLSVFTTMILEILLHKFQNKTLDELKQIVGANAGKMYEDYKWQTMYWFYLYEPQ